MPTPSVSAVPPSLQQLPLFGGLTPVSPRGAPFAWHVGRGGRWRSGAGTGWYSGKDGNGGCQPAGGGCQCWPHHTEHLCTGFMGEFLGQWKTRPNSSNCETLPRTLPGEGTTQGWAPPFPSLPAAMHPLRAPAHASSNPPPAPGMPTTPAGASTPKGTPTHTLPSSSSRG